MHVNVLVELSVYNLCVSIIVVQFCALDFCSVVVLIIKSYLFAKRGRGELIFSHVSGGSVTPGEARRSIHAGWDFANRAGSYH